jgi:CheY-like chemotaxis protein
MKTAVLVVDDDGDLRRFIADCLEEAGHTVLQAPNGRDALDLLRGHPTRLVVLLDMHMPVMGGIELLQTLDDEPALGARHGYIMMSNTPVERLTPEVRELLTQRHIPYVFKSFDASELTAIITSAAEQVGALD